jgi:hypothetical protein
VHDAALQLVTRAEPPPPSGLTQEQDQNINELIAKLPPGNDRRDDWITIAALNVRLVPAAGARWIPETAILPPKYERDRRKATRAKIVDL